MADPILPNVRLIFACDSAIINLSDRKWELKHPWSVVMLPEGAEFPFRLLEAWVYAQFTGGVGAFHLAVELLQVMDDDSRRWIGRTPPERVDFPGGQQLVAFDTAFPLKKVPFREAGIYEFRVVAEHDNTEGAVALDGATAQIRVLGRWA